MSSINTMTTLGAPAGASTANQVVSAITSDSTVSQLYTARLLGKDTSNTASAGSGAVVVVGFLAVIGSFTVSYTADKYDGLMKLRFPHRTRSRPSALRSRRWLRASSRWGAT